MRVRFRLARAGSDGRSEQWQAAGVRARTAKNPATAAASCPASGSTSDGDGPPSSARLGSQNAMSNSPFPTRARFQSRSSVWPSRKHRLSLLTSKWSNCVPSSRASVLAWMRLGSARFSHDAVHNPVDSNGSGFLAISGQPTICARIALSLSMAGGGLVRCSRSSAASTASIRPRDQGGGHAASLRSSMTMSVDSWSYAPRNEGMNGPRTVS